jgi:pyroglutamyl-peptidase
MTSDARTVVLLTGFGPFPGVPVNATMRLVPALATAAAKAFPDVRFVTDILPTEWLAAPVRLEGLFADHAPDLALHFGVSRRARGFEIERRGLNVCSGADAAGSDPTAGAINDDGADLHQVDLPVSLMVERLRRRGIAANHSWDAGRYLCNAVLYQSLELSRGSSNRTRSAFIHLPTNLALGLGRQLQRDGSCRLTWPDAINGGIEIIATCLGRQGVRASPGLKVMARAPR